MAAHHDRAVRLSILVYQLHPEGGDRHRRIQGFVEEIGLMNTTSSAKGAGDNGQLGSWLLGGHKAPLKESGAAGGEQRPVWEAKGLLSPLGTIRLPR